MEDDERRGLVFGALVRDAFTEPERWWWLSFADGNLPVGSQFLGVAIVRGQGLAWACRRAHELKINPGGSVQGQELPDGFEPPESYRDRLLTRAECAAFDAEVSASR